MDYIPLCSVLRICLLQPNLRTNYDNQRGQLVQQGIDSWRCSEFHRSSGTSPYPHDPRNNGGNTIWYIKGRPCCMTDHFKEASSVISTGSTMHNMCVVRQCIDGQSGDYALANKAENTEEASFKWSVLHLGCALIIRHGDGVVGWRVETKILSYRIVTESINTLRPGEMWQEDLDENFISSFLNEMYGSREVTCVKEILKSSGRE